MSILNISTLLAMAPPAGGAENPQSPVHMFGMMFIFIAIFWFVLIRPQQRREKERRAMLDMVKKGDRVLFGGGLLGSVSNTKEKTLMIKIAEGVKVEVSRGAVSAILEKGEEVADPQSV